MGGNRITTIVVILILVMTYVSGCVGNDSEDDSLGTLVIAYEIKDNIDNIDENPLLFAEYLSKELNYDVSLFSVDSELSLIHI